MTYIVSGGALNSTHPPGKSYETSRGLTVWTSMILDGYRVLYHMYTNKVNIYINIVIWLKTVENSVIMCMLNELISLQTVV